MRRAFDADPARSRRGFDMDSARIRCESRRGWTDTVLPRCIIVFVGVTFCAGPFWGPPIDEAM
eukprot:3775737-Pyramimonas_sp.AAC.1